MLAANNLSDVANVNTARSNIGAAPLASPTFTGDPQAPTPGAADNDNSIATTAFVKTAVAAVPAPVAATAAEYLANSAPTKMLTPGAIWSASNMISLGVASSVTPDFNTGIDFQWTLNSTTGTLNNPTNAKLGQKGLIYINQDATGSRAITTWGSAWKFPGGNKPTLTATANATDIISYAVTAAGVICCNFSGNFA
jgi:hypothetical protein